MSIQSGSDIEEFVRDYYGAANAKTLRNSEFRRRHLEQFAAIISQENPELYLTSKDGQAAYIELDDSGRRITIPSWKIPQQTTNYDRKPFDMLMQRTLTLHAVGHILYTDQKAVNEALTEVDTGQEDQFRNLWNALEDGAIEKQLRHEFNAKEEIQIMNANVFPPEDRFQGYSLFEAAHIACLDFCVFDTGNLEQLLDPDVPDVEFKNPSDRRTFVQEILPEVRSAAIDVTNETNPSARADRILDFWKAVQEYFDDEAKTSLDYDNLKGDHVIQDPGGSRTTGGLAGGSETALDQQNNTQSKHFSEDPEKKGGSSQQTQSHGDGKTIDKQSDDPETDAGSNERGNNCQQQGTAGQQNSNSEEIEESDCHDNNKEQERKITGDAIEQSGVHRTSAEVDEKGLNGSDTDNYSLSGDEPTTINSNGEKEDSNVSSQHQVERYQQASDEFNQEQSGTFTNNSIGNSRRKTSDEQVDGKNTKDNKPVTGCQESEDSGIYDDPADNEGLQDNSITEISENDADNDVSASYRQTTETNNDAEIRGQEANSETNQEVKKSELFESDSPGLTEAKHETPEIDEKNGGSGGSSSIIREDVDTGGLDTLSTDDLELESKYDELVNEEAADVLDKVSDLQDEYELLQEIIEEAEDNENIPNELEIVSGREIRREAWPETRRAADRLRRILGRRLQQEDQVRVRRNLTRGEIDTRSLPQVRMNNPRIFRQEDVPDMKDYSCVIVLDRSGSMSGQIHATEEAATALAKALEDLEIDTCVIDFCAGEPRVAKPFGDSVRSTLDALLTGETGGGTPLGSAVELASERVETKDGEPFVLIITDGQPNDDSVYMNALEKLNCPVLGVYLQLSLSNSRALPSNIQQSANLFDRRKIITDSDRLSSRLESLCREVMF